MKFIPHLYWINIVMILTSKENKVINLLDKLPIELYNYITFMSIGSLSLDTYNKKKSINKQLLSYTNENNDFYLHLICDYEKTPELEMNWDDYCFAHRVPKLEKVN